MFCNQICYFVSKFIRVMINALLSIFFCPDLHTFPGNFSGLKSRLCHFWFAFRMYASGSVIEMVIDNHLWAAHWAKRLGCLSTPENKFVMMMMRMTNIIIIIIYRRRHHHHHHLRVTLSRWWWGRANIRLHNINIIFMTECHSIRHQTPKFPTPPKSYATIFFGLRRTLFWSN